MSTNLIKISKRKFLVIFYVAVLTTFMLITKVSRSSILFLPVLILPIIVYIFIWYVISSLDIKFDRNTIWIVTILLRLITLFFPIGLSDDVYRYIWDGQVQHAGYNPYLYPPNATELETIRTENWKHINHKDISTPYPPVSQIIFFILTTFTTGTEVTILIFRITMIAFDLGTIYLIEQLLLFLEKSKSLIVLYAWSPLVILEFAGNAHNDIIAIFFMVVAIYLSMKYSGERKYSIISSISITLAILVKVFPLIVLPFLLKKWRVFEYLGSIITTLLTSLPYYKSGINPIYPEGQQIFVMYFRFNESLFRIYERIITELTSSQLLPRIIYATSIVFISILFLYRYYTITSLGRNPHIILLKSIGFLLLFGLLFGPDVQPWYVLWLLPIAVIISDRAAIVFSITVIFSYSIYPTYDLYGIWKENMMILFLEYIPVYSLFVLQLKRGFYTEGDLDPNSI